jgi:hypothetical protein
VYNHFLNERVDAYLNRKETLNYYDNVKELIKLKKDKTWLKKVNNSSKCEQEASTFVESLVI